MNMESTGSAQAVPAVSVVVPCFNGGRYLDDLTASLAHQTFSDFETIIVDDGSTDTLTAQKLAQLEHRARIIRQSNRGVSAARNAGVGAARADLVFMLDCDDMIEPTFLAKAVAALRPAPPDVGMVAAQTRVVGAETGILPVYFNRFDLLFSNTMSCALLLRKESWRAAGGSDETMRDGYEDWEFSLRLVRAGFRGITLAEPLYIYRVENTGGATGISSSVHAKRLYAKLWREIRKRHPQSYRPLALARIWRTSRDGSGRIPFCKGFAGYVLACALPDDVFNALYARLHRRRPPIEDGALQA
jgi:glycosyltransferase involved in cell wall biosynthesis